MGTPGDSGEADAADNDRIEDKGVVAVETAETAAGTPGVLEGSAVANADAASHPDVERDAHPSNETHELPPIVPETFPLHECDFAPSLVGPLVPAVDAPLHESLVDAETSAKDALRAREEFEQRIRQRAEDRQRVERERRERERERDEEERQARSAAGETARAAPALPAITSAASDEGGENSPVKKRPTLLDKLGQVFKPHR